MVSARPALMGWSMQNSTLVAAFLAPLLAPVVRWLFLKPGRMCHDWLWKRLPEGKMRKILLKRVP